MSKPKRIHKTYKKSIFEGLKFRLVNVLILLSVLALLFVLFF